MPREPADEHYYHAHDLAKFGEIGKNRTELADKFFAWYGAVFADGALSVREKALIQVVRPKAGPPCQTAALREESPAAEEWAVGAWPTAKSPAEPML